MAQVQPWGFGRSRRYVMLIRALVAAISKFSANVVVTRGQPSPHFCLKSGILSDSSVLSSESPRSDPAGSVPGADLEQPEPRLCCEGHGPAGLSQADRDTGSWSAES